ncbi:F0F1 ATP synthase subunit epsilon [Actinoallomurus vinaceus]|uniref:ATP synthase epsilon chain n=1 Tax=Actinoallomurus vinaceus TaxID=1080074 RepID=A0ABP8UP55_9ACTN
MAKLHVELVSPEREIWAGEADMVVAKTIEGEMGILPGHAPVLGLLVDGSVVRIKPADESAVISAMVSGGFFSVASDEVSVLAEYAELGGEIDLAAAREEYERVSGLEGEEAAVAQRRARARLRAAGEEI